MKNCLTLFLLLLFSSNLFAESRIKDVVTIKGVRSNPLIGYGLVIGLNGTGDGGGEITNSSLKRMFQKLGLSPEKEVNSKNVAAVIVTAKLPPFGRVGQKVDVIVSSVGDASSLAGGTLLVTPLKGGDGQIYAVANGPLSIGGLEKGAKFPTTGRVVNGAVVEKEVPIKFDEKESLRLSLNTPDFTTAARVEQVINQELGGKYAHAQDSTTIDLIIPAHYKRNIVKLIAIIENFRVNIDNSAKIVINERTGTVVAGGGIFLKSVAISHGNLTIEVAGGGQAPPQSVHMVEKNSTLNELVKALNAIGASPEDIITIFQALKTNGALVGDLEFI